MADEVLDLNATVKEFQDKFETSTDPDLWVKLVLEEKKEVEEAAAHLLKELSDLLYVTVGLENHIGSTGARIAIERAGGLPSAVIMDLFDAFGDILDEAFRRVHASNMSKLGDDGKPVRREDGKVLKGPNYQPPNLDDLVR
jgi:predicted HAD superfamily Cof-like phosphohydrolase